MPLRKFPPRPDRPSPNGSRRDALYDQLLSSLGVSDKLPTSKEHWQWVHEQRRAGQNFSPLDQTAPWPHQRFEALTLLQNFDWPTYLRCRQVLHESEDLDLDLDREPVMPLSEKQIEVDWIHMREGLIGTYQLDGLVPSADGRGHHVGEGNSQPPPV